FNVNLPVSPTSYKPSNASANDSGTTALKGTTGRELSRKLPKKSTLKPDNSLAPVGRPSESNESLIPSTTASNVAVAFGPLRFLTSSVVIRLKNLALT